MGHGTLEKASYDVLSCLPVQGDDAKEQLLSAVESERYLVLFCSFGGEIPPINHTYTRLASHEPVTVIQPAPVQFFFSRRPVPFLTSKRVEQVFPFIPFLKVSFQGLAPFAPQSKKVASLE